MEARVARLEREVQLLNDRLRDPKLEKFYQTYLEQKFQASHTRVSHGITDIETDDSIIEIKNWKNYKTAIGQLLSYTNRNNKKRIAYFFGNKPKNMEEIIHLYQSYNIEIYHIYEDSTKIIVEEVLTSAETDPFYKWLDEHVVFVENNIVQLGDIISIYLKGHIHPKHASIYKTKLENFVIKRFSSVLFVDHKYKKLRIQDKTCYGWKHLKLVS